MKTFKEKLNSIWTAIKVGYVIYSIVFLFIPLALLIPGMCVLFFLVVNGTIRWNWNDVFDFLQRYDIWLYIWLGSWVPIIFVGAANSDNNTEKTTKTQEDKFDPEENERMFNYYMHGVYGNNTGNGKYINGVYHDEIEDPMGRKYYSSVTETFKDE